MSESVRPGEFRKFEHQGWQKAANRYGPGFGSVTTQSIPALLDAVEAGAGTRLLDVASGPGYVAAAAAARRCRVTGIDFSSEMVAVARKHNPGLEFLEDDAENMKFESATFEAVVMNFGMLHLARPELAMAEAFRVLKSGGRYGFTVWDTPEKAVGFEIVLQSIQTHGNMNVNIPAGPPFFRFSDPEESRHSLVAAGFSDIRSAQIPQVWQLESGDALFTTMRTAAVRTAALLQMQTPEALQSIRSAIGVRAETFRKGNVVELPMPSILISARKP